MRFAKAFSLAVNFAMLALLVPVLAAAAPAPGIYPSAGISGQVFPGRFIQSEDEGLALKPGAGDVLSFASWDGSQLGTQWSVTCAVAMGPESRKPMLDEKGNGYVLVVNTFTGGRFLLTRFGPWGGGVDAFGTVNQTELSVTYYYLGGKLDHVEAFVDARGKDRSGRTVRISSGVCDAWGECDGAMKNYPPLLDMACNETRDEGYWWDMSAMKIEIFGLKPQYPLAMSEAKASVPTEIPAPSWGAVKVLYR